MALRGKKKKMIAALRENSGIIKNASLNAKIDRGTHYEWLKKDPEYKKEVEIVAEESIDFVESQLHKLIKEKEKTAIIFYLKTKAKHRGYVENDYRNDIKILNVNAVGSLNDGEKEDLLQEIQEVKSIECEDKDGKD